MAKVTGPLFSISATGKIADAVVYFPWKGLHIVRQWLKPSNPQSGDQGDRRVMLGGLGRAPKYIQKDTVYYNHALGVTVPPQTWISAFVKYIMQTYFTNVAGFDAIVAAYGASGIAGEFNDAALGLGLATFDITYKDMDNVFSPGMQLYCLAQYGCDQYLLNNLKFATAPYTKPFGTWVAQDVTDMVADFTP